MTAAVCTGIIMREQLPVDHVNLGVTGSKDHQPIAEMAADRIIQDVQPACKRAHGRHDEPVTIRDEAFAAQGSPAAFDPRHGVKVP